jgi:hypothetical protein
MVKLCWAAGLFVRLKNLCYNNSTMYANRVPATESPVPPKPTPSGAEGPEAPATVELSPKNEKELSPAELRARRLLIAGLVVAGLFLLSLVVLLVFLSVDAYRAAYAGAGPSPGEVVVGLLRDAAIIFVAFETLLIGVLLIILTMQVQSLVVLLRDEIRPMLEAANETLATVRGTTQFVSHNVVSPVMKWSGYLAGLRRIAREISGLDKSEE